MKPLIHNHSVYMIKDHSVSSPNLHQYANHSQKQIIQTCPLNVVKKLNEIVNYKQHNLNKNS